MPLGLPLGATPAPRAARSSGVVAALFVAVAIAATFANGSPAARAVAAVVLLAFGALFQHVLSRPGPPPHGWIVVDHEGLWRFGAEGASILAYWHQPFGVTVLSSADRSAILIAITTPRATRYVAARITDAEDAVGIPNLIEAATTAADSDLRPNDDAAMSASHAEKLLCEIARRAPLALSRAYLSDASGEPIVLDHPELRVGSRRIDLSAPLEWRAFIFHESGAQAASVCQATWVRQGDSEIVLVAPLPGDVAWVRAPSVVLGRADEARILQRAVARDIRLMEAAAGDPPPRELRRAIDRVFMLPLRRALEDAPRAIRVASVPPRPMPEGRA